MIDNTYGLSEGDLLRVPMSTGYVDYPLVNLLNFSGGPLRSTSNFGMPPVRFITQRGPFQDGETPLDMRLDPRVLQVAIVDYLCNRTEFWTRRNELIDLIRPNRAFSAASATFNPLVYRKFLPGGKPERGSDLKTVATSPIVTSDYGRFVHYGGLQVGDYFELTSGGDVGIYTIIEVENDYTLTLDANMTTTAPDPAIPPYTVELPVQYRYYRNRAVRDLDVLLEQGPTFDERVGTYQYPAGYREALRFVAHDPVWRGTTQSETWGIDETLGDLVFDLAGAWFGVTPGTGRWLFAPNYVGETTNVVYWGTWPAKPQIIIAGPATNPTIENSTLGVRIELDYSVALGETVTIDTRLLTCTNNSAVNLLPYLTGDLATFELSPEPQAPGRANAVTVNFSDGFGGQSAAHLTWQNRYIAI